MFKIAPNINNCPARKKKFSVSSQYLTDHFDGWSQYCWYKLSFDCLIFNFYKVKNEYCSQLTTFLNKNYSILLKKLLITLLSLFVWRNVFFGGWSSVLTVHCLHGYAFPRGAVELDYVDHFSIVPIPLKGVRAPVT